MGYRLSNDLKSGIGNDLPVEDLGSEFDLTFEEKDDFVKKDVSDLSIPTINSLDLKTVEYQKDDSGDSGDSGDSDDSDDSDFEGFDDNDESYVYSKELNLENKKLSILMKSL